MGADTITISQRRPDGAGRPLGWWGVVLTISSEGMLFVLLLFSYFFLRAKAPQWPPEGVKDPELIRSAIFSVILWSSSATMRWAEQAITRARRRATVTGLLLTLLLAGLFLGNHVHEMLSLPAEYTWRDHAYGSLVYVITNFHAVHLVAGMVMIGFAAAATAKGHHTAEDHLGLRITGMYWHFVDAVWVAVYATLYVSPHLS